MAAGASNETADAKALAYNARSLLQRKNFEKFWKNGLLDKATLQYSRGRYFTPFPATEG